MSPGPDELDSIIKKMVLLSQPHGKTLVPYHAKQILPFATKCIGLDYPAPVIDFLNYPNHKIYDTVILIPPRASYRNIDPKTKSKLVGHDRNTNLYVFNIDKALDHLSPKGELVCYSPKDFLKSAPELNNKIYKLGTVTDVINTDRGTNIIWRFVKGDSTKKTLFNGMWRNFTAMNNQLLFLVGKYTVPFSDLFSIKVGAISGLDEVFASPGADTEFITSQTPITGETKMMYFNQMADALTPHKKKLISRKIKQFNETNWWMWGRSHHISNGPRVYVSCKTKQVNPFFVHECKNYDGSILALFFKTTVKVSSRRVADLLNKVDWIELGFQVGRRLMFNRRSLEGLFLPEEFQQVRV